MEGRRGNPPRCDLELFDFVLVYLGFSLLVKGIRLLVSLHEVSTGNNPSKLLTAHASSHPHPPPLPPPVFSAIFPALSREGHNPVSLDGRFNRLNGFGYNVEA